MKYVFGAIVLIHGLIHILGFVKGFELKEVKELTLPISRQMGILWLTAGILFLSYGILHFANFKYSWLVGFAAVLVSQILIILFWEDAKFGTISTVLILAVAMTSFGNYNFQRLVQKETNSLLSQNDITENRILTERDISKLPVVISVRPCQSFRSKRATLKDAAMI